MRSIPTLRLPLALLAAGGLAVTGALAQDLVGVEVPSGFADQADQAPAVSVDDDAALSDSSDEIRSNQSGIANQQIGDEPMTMPSSFEPEAEPEQSIVEATGAPNAGDPLNGETNFEGPSPLIPEGGLTD